MKQKYNIMKSETIIKIVETLLKIVLIVCVLASINLITKIIFK